MLAAQMVAAHNAAMECYRRAMLGEQTFEGRKENLTQANKLSRTYHPAGGPEPPSRQGSAEGHRRARPRPCRRPGHCRRCRGRGWGGERKSKATPCKGHYPCTCRPVVGRKPGAGARAGRRRCRTADAECTGALAGSTKGQGERQLSPWPLHLRCDRERRQLKRGSGRWRSSRGPLNEAGRNRKSAGNGQ